MSDRPIIMSGESVRAILAGRKTQSRRVARFVPLSGEGHTSLAFSGVSVGEYCTGVPSSGRVLYVRRGGGVWHQITEPLHCPYGAAGVRLWVREAFRLRRDQDDVPPSQDWWKSGAWYAADPDSGPSGCMGGSGKLRSPIHMPRWASRLTLEVVSVRVERLQAISEDDARAEGAMSLDNIHPIASARSVFEEWWAELNGKRPGCAWDDNPWVWVLTFRRVEQKEG